MASVHRQENRRGVSWRVIWREDGKQRSLSFADRQSAERFQQRVDTHGPAEALRVLEIEEAGARHITVAEALKLHIDSLTGVEPATIKRYRAYLDRDIAPAFGDLPLDAVTDQTIGTWVQGLVGSGKTISNKHGFLSGAFRELVRRGMMPTNPCEGRRLPRTRRDDMVFLTGAEFKLLRDCIPRERWQRLATWLVATGMRFGEATALTPADIDPAKRTARITKAWKYSGDYRPTLGPPKTKRSVRTISLPDRAFEVIDLTAGEWLFTNGAGNPVRAQEFYNGGWNPGRIAAAKLGLTKRPRVHDLRHTAASWMIQAGVPLAVVQAHLGHESIQTTISVYSHLDTKAMRGAAAALNVQLGNE